MKSKKPLVVVAVIGLIVAIGAVALLPAQQAAQTEDGEALAPEGLKITLESLTVDASASRAFKVDVVLEATNPDPPTVLLQYVKYTISADGRRIHTGLIGERPEGFVASSNFVTLIQDRPATLSDSALIRNTGSDPEFWGATLAGELEWSVAAEASYSYSSMVAGGENLETFEFALVPTIS